MGCASIEETPTISSGAAYASLDAVGGKLEFENAVTPYSNHGHVIRAMLSDKGKQNALLYLVLFSEDFTATADNAAFDPSDADLLNVIGIIEFPVANYSSFADNSVCTTGFAGVTMDLPFNLVSGGTSLFGQLMVKTQTPTYTSTSDLQVRLHVHS